MIYKVFNHFEGSRRRFVPFKLKRVDMRNYNSRTYKNIWFLRNWLDCRGKIVPRRKKPGIKAKQQKKVTRLIKRARQNALLPYIQTKKWRKRKKKWKNIKRKRS